MKKKAAALNGPRPIAENSNSKNYKSKFWGSGASYSPTSRADMTLWVKAFLIRYYELLAVSDETDGILDFVNP